MTLLNILRSPMVCLLAVLIAGACAPVYVPNTRNNPLFEGKGEFQVSATAGIGYNIQSAYALTDHIGVMGNFLVANNKKSDRFRYRTQQMGELGIGYFTKRGSLYLEIYGGLGIGKGTATDSVYYIFVEDVLYEANARYRKYFLQPAFGTKREHFEWSFSPRISSLYFNAFDISHNDEPVAMPDRSYLYFEPALTLKIPIQKQKVFFMMQSGVNLPLYHQKDDFNIERVHAVAGLHVRIAPKN